MRSHLPPRALSRRKVHDLQSLEPPHEERSADELGGSGKISFLDEVVMLDPLDRCIESGPALLCHFGQRD